METWNRDDLYVEVWEQPLVKIARKYGVSNVMIGKVCRKLQIPLPGRGYWTKKEFGKPVERVPLPEAKDLPIVNRFKEAPTVATQIEQRVPPEPESTDDLYRSIVEMESRTITVDPNTKIHKLVAVAAKTLSRSQPDSRGILATKWDQAPCLDIRVTKTSLDRAVTLINAIVMALEAEQFTVSVEEAGKRSTSVLIFGQSVPFAITEKVREIGRRQVKEYSWTKTIIDYEGRGTLEFRTGDHGYGLKIRDSKKNRLETLIPQCIGALMREARSRVHTAEDAKRMEIERQKKARERAELAEQIAEEEKKVSALEAWVADWTRAKLMREFIAELEKVWKGENLDLSPDTPKGKGIIWMKQQADRIDPMLPSPPSILDRKRELNYW